MPSPLQIKIDETKKFIKKYQIPIAFSVGAVATCYVVRDIQLYTKRDIVSAMRDTVLVSVNDVIDTDNQCQLDFLTMSEFITDKGLFDEYRSFYDMMND